MQMKCAARKLSTTRNKSRLFNKYDKTHQNVRSRKLPAHLPSKMVLKEDQLLRYKVVEAPHTLYVHGVLPCVEGATVNFQFAYACFAYSHGFGQAYRAQLQRILRLPFLFSKLYLLVNNNQPRIN